MSYMLIIKFLLYLFCCCFYLFCCCFSEHCSLDYSGTVGFISFLGLVMCFLFLFSSPLADIGME